MPPLRSNWRSLRVLSVVLIILGMLFGALPAGATPAPIVPQAHTPEGTYRNPAPIFIPDRYGIPGSDFAESFADPHVIKAKDGFYYAYGTRDPLTKEDPTFHFIPQARSNDLVHWTYVGDAFSEQNLPPYADPSTSLWAPDVKYMNDRYYLYYTVTNTNVSTCGFDTAIGVATSINPTGPWTHSPTPVVAPRGNPDNPEDCGAYRWTFDPYVFTDLDGQRYIYYGSYYGGIEVRRLSQDGFTSVAPGKLVGRGDRFEGAWVKRHGDYVYLFGSSADCCNEEMSGYSVFAGRSTSPMGPFLDRNGVDMANIRAGGTPVIQPNGNEWVGTGHNSVIPDISGQDWFYYHAQNRFDPVLKYNEERPRDSINRRPMLMDRLDWINGFPTVRGDYWASNTLQRAPVTTGTVYDEFNRTTGIGGRWTVMGGRWRLVNPASGTNRGYVRQTSTALDTQQSGDLAMLISDGRSPANYRVEADLRLRASGGTGARYGVVTSYVDRNNYIIAWLVPGAGGMGGSLVTVIRSGGVNSVLRTALPATFNHTDFHTLEVELRGRTLTFRVSESRLQDYLAVQTRQLPPPTTQQGVQLGAGRVGFATRFASADFDNISAAQLYTPRTERRPLYQYGTLDPAYSDEFTDECQTGVFDKYQWGGPAAPPAAADYGFVNRNGNCYFRLRTLTGDLYEGANNTSILVSKLPITGNFTVETKVQFNVPIDPECCYNYQQAGTLVYKDPDHYLRLMHVSVWGTRITEFAKETTNTSTTGPGEPHFGGMTEGPPAFTTFLRIVRRVDTTTGKETYTAYTRQAGKAWVRGGTWTHRLGNTPAANVRTALAAFGWNGTDFRSTAWFDYIRVYRP